MLADFLDRLVALANKANDVQVHEVPGFPNHVALRSGTAVDLKEKPARGRFYVIRSLGDLIALVKDKAICTAPEVFHGGGLGSQGVRVVLDRAKRTEVAFMPTHETDRFATLRKLRREPTGMFVPEAIRLLRFDLQAVGADALVAALRRVDFKRTEAGGATTEHGRESLGRSVEAIVQQAADIPEMFVANAPIYQVDGLRHIAPAVPCGVYLDVHAQKVALRPYADAIEEAVSAAQAEIHAILTAALPGVAVFQGEPVLEGEE